MDTEQQKDKWRRWQRDWRASNKERAGETTRRWQAAHPERMRQYRARRGAELQAALRAIKAEYGCANCPESEPCALHFHHLNPADKKFALAAVRSTTRSFNSVQKEIDKCLLLCANCHAKVTNGQTACPTRPKTGYKLPPRPGQPT